MKKIFLALLAFLPAMANAELIKNEVDPNDGTHYVVGEGGVAGTWFPISLVCAQMKDGERVWNLRITVNSKKAQQIQRNQQLKLTFSDKSTMTLYSMSEIGPDDYEVIDLKKGKKQMYLLTPEYPLTKAQMMEIVSKNATAGHMVMNNGEKSDVKINMNRFSGSLKDQYFTICKALRDADKTKPEAEQRFIFNEN